MQNISTIYRFNTPFLDISTEKESLISIRNKIKIFIEEFESIELIEEKEDLGEYIKFKFTDKKELLKLRFYYIKEFTGNYYMPIFKMDIFLDREKLDDKIIVGFLVNIFECFDGLNEKEYLISLDNTIYYKKRFFINIFPEHHFSDLEKIEEEFEKNNGNKLIEEFILNFSNKKFNLTTGNSEKYHKIHSIILYYIYLVYVMYQNIYDSNKQLNFLEDLEPSEFNAHKELAQKRLQYINSISIENFKKYYSRLEVFFNLFKQ